MLSVTDFRTLCRDEDSPEIVDKVLLSFGAEHVTEDDRQHILASIANKFALPHDRIFVWIVGSAKLGFSISEKKLKDRKGTTLKRYRPFSGGSDIDVAVVSPCLFRIMWDELSTYAHGKPYIPWNSQKLGDYFVYGWLRPDHFPRGPSVRLCNDWWDIFHYLSKDTRFDYRKVRGGLFYSLNDLKRYLKRSVDECIAFET